MASSGFGLVLSESDGLQCPQWPAEGAGEPHSGSLVYVLSAVTPHLVERWRIFLCRAAPCLQGSRRWSRWYEGPRRSRSRFLPDQETNIKNKWKQYRYTVIHLHAIFPFFFFLSKTLLTYQWGFIAKKVDGVQSFLLQDVQTEAFVPALREHVKTDQTPWKQTETHLKHLR